MLRNILTCMALGLVASTAAGGAETETATNVADKSAQAIAVPNIEFAPQPLPVISAPVGAAAAAPTEPSSAHTEPSDVKLTSAMTTIAAPVDCNCGERPYHPVCDCGCKVPCLDRWCTWDVIRCDSCWCNETPCDCAQGSCRLTEDNRWVCNDACCDVWGPPAYRANGAVRFGYWAISNDGSQQKTGEFQDLASSPFWDVDTINSDGCRTWDIVLSGLDQEAYDARVHYYGPEMKAKVDFQQYFRRLDHDPVAGYDLAPGQVPPATPDANVIADDLNIGENYAIRVQEFDSKFQGKITDNVKWKMNVWSMRKFGERQANATAHCFNVSAPAAAGATGNTCHVLSQRQAIDWATVDVTPGVEARFDSVTVEYTHTFRSFGQDDQAVDRQYTRFNFNTPAASGQLGPAYEYAIVPENTTNIDRVKIGAELTEDNKFYANMYYGDTQNEFRDTHRTFDGYDLRLINTSIDDLTLTGYTSRYDEENELPPFFLSGAPYSSPNTYDQDSVTHPIDYSRTRAGIKSGWQPFGDRGSRCTNYGLLEGTTLASGYEYYLLERDYATYDTALGPFTQPDTKSHQIEFGPSTKWSRSFETFTRYKVRFIEDPLIGVRENNGRFNTNQPEQVHITEVGYNWSPTSNFMTTTQVDFVNSWNDSEYANFSENNYPINITAWYAPTNRLSLTGGYAYFSNWIDQDITLGFTTPDVLPPPVVTETTNWSYWGENHLVSFSANYAVTQNVQLIGGYEWDRGTNTFLVPPSPAGADWSLLPSFANVVVETQRLTTGIDYQPMCNTNLYFRYVYFDWDDRSANLYSGTSHMFLAGATRTW